MTPEDAARVRNAGASYQRGKPESAMLRLQEDAGGGVYPHAAEHIGDLTHRMNESSGRFGTEYVRPKIESTYDSLHRGYGFEREMDEQVSDNARYRKVDEGAFRSTVNQRGMQYAAEHRNVPVYNYPSEVARDAAVSLGEQRFDDTRAHMGVLHNMQFGGGGYAEGDLRSLIAPSSPEDNKQSMVDYLRDKESRTPAFTDAATVMLGGKLRP
jgi:hypothetical protein